MKQFIHLHSDVTSSFFVLHVSPFTKAYKKGSTKFGILWQRRVCRGVRCHLEEVSPSREDESTPDGNDTVSHRPWPSNSTSSLFSWGYYLSFVFCSYWIDVNLANTGVPYIWWAYASVVGIVTAVSLSRLCHYHWKRLAN